MNIMMSLCSLSPAQSLFPPPTYFSTHLVYKYKAGVKSQHHTPPINPHMIRPEHGGGMEISHVRIGLVTGWKVHVGIWDAEGP